MDITIDATRSAFPQSTQVVQPTQRVGIGRGAFWGLFVAEALLILLVCAFIIPALRPGHVPLSNTGDYIVVQDAVRARLNGTMLDPLVEVAPGVVARASNLRGFTLNGYTYYYQLAGERGFDPLSRGAVSAGDVDVVLTDNAGPSQLVIYRIRS